LKKRAAPSVGKIKVGHVEDEHGVVPVHTSSKTLAQRLPEIVSVLFGFHDKQASVQPAPHHRAVAGFCRPPFEGANKSGAAAENW
jgi:hypothetical protein